MCIVHIPRFLANLLSDSCLAQAATIADFILEYLFLYLIVYTFTLRFLKICKAAKGSSL